jgi:hypothetical protein
MLVDHIVTLESKTKKVLPLIFVFEQEFSCFCSLLRFMTPLKFCCKLDPNESTTKMSTTEQNGLETIKTGTVGSSNNLFY